MTILRPYQFGFESGGSPGPLYGSGERFDWDQCGILGQSCSEQEQRSCCSGHPSSCRYLPQLKYLLSPLNALYLHRTLPTVVGYRVRNFVSLFGTIQGYPASMCRHRHYSIGVFSAGTESRAGVIGKTSTTGKLLVSHALCSTLPLVSYVLSLSS